MTPNDIATDVNGLKPVGGGDITGSVSGSQSFVGQNWSIDDWNNWG